MLYREGKAVISAGKRAFLNPKMSRLRSISVAFLRATSTGKESLLDSTAASGIRGIRYSLESGIRNITLIDINSDAIPEIRSNLKRNKVKARVIDSSIQEFAASNPEPFDVIDLDPFGSPAPHVHDLLKICKDRTMLLVTATDTAVLCGAHADACIKVYGAKPLHNELCKESGIRILTGFIARNASQFNFGIVPLLSVSEMHYMRLFLRLERGAGAAVNSVKELGFVAACRSCHSFRAYKGIVPEINGRCENCKGGMDLSGPMWLGSINDKKVLSKMYGDKNMDADARSTIRKIYNEPDSPFFYSIPAMTRSMHIGAVSPIRVIETLKGKGYAAASTQFEKDAVKTDAPISAVVKSIKQAEKS